MRNYLRNEKQKINQDPQGGRRFWFVLLVGCFVALGGTYFFISPPANRLEFATPLQVGGGAGMALTAAAELLPKEKRRLAATLRKLALAVMALSLVWVATIFLP